MKLIVGLGNPGSGYVKTRHNVGHMVIDVLQGLKLPKDVVLKKSDTFMNQSGEFVKSQVAKYKIKNEDLYIIHDDLDIFLGEFKIQFGRGPKDHNGLKSVNDAIATNQYWHVRVGVDNRPGDNRPMGEEYVLQNFSDEEMGTLDGVIKELCHKLISDLQSNSPNGI
jgi:PTH1 family peptidyl-tRNA hydrolase